MKRQLILLCTIALVGGAFLWDGRATRAQDIDGFSTDTPALRKKLTRDEAAREFKSLLLKLSGKELYYVDEIDKDLKRVISHKSMQELRDHAPRVAFVLASQLNRHNQIVKVESEGDKSAIVTVEDDPTPPPRPFVMVKEDGTWGVDLIETYARWNHLEGIDKAEAIYDLAGVTLPGLPHSPKMDLAGCQQNLRDISMGINQYAQDYDGKYPLAKNWMDTVVPYLKSQAVFTCPALLPGQKYGYAFNSRQANKPFGSYASRAQNVLIYETILLKRNAYGTGENRAFRHSGGSNYVFADSHVKWFDKSQTPSFNFKP